MSLWKLSAGTASVLGLRRVVCDAPPTTAYVMLGEKCRHNCSFCAQARDSQAKTSLLSRVTWPEAAAGRAVAGIASAHAAGKIKRVCLQVVNSENSWQETLQSLAALQADALVPVCVSGNVTAVSDAEILIAAGADRVSIALDAATPAVHKRAKGGSWEWRWRLLCDCAAALPGRIATHLIVGLGESEEEMVGILADCIERGITVGLFAFTPIRGTAWADYPPPPLGQYRRVQIAHYLLRQGYSRNDIIFNEGRITALRMADWQTLLADGRAFETSGCPDCNRPYYNERPGGVLYNYPRPLADEEIKRAIAASGLTAGGDSL
ncbi:MAG: radical SAM protein [Negativicutes bacterium]|nr:radical SAM protein [Negativicutes bacterium]